MMLERKKGSSKVELLRWWRNWVTLLTTLCVVMLLIIILLGGSAVVIGLLGLSVIYGVFQIAALTRRVNTET